MEHKVCLIDFLNIDLYIGELCHAFQHRLVPGFRGDGACPAGWDSRSGVRLTGDGYRESVSHELPRPGSIGGTSEDVLYRTRDS
jgi:hypothetical protein